MKIAIGFKVLDKPWGGGNRFVKILTEYLLNNGHQVINTLEDTDIDIILLMDPRKRHESVTFTAADIDRYILFKNKKAIVVHRINECDERKGTSHMNAKLRRANYSADHTVFVGSWLVNLNLWHKLPQGNYTIIKNGADTRIFNCFGHINWDGYSPLLIVTHHWGANLMKGFDVYNKLDHILESYKQLFKFTYIGNLPKGIKFKNIRHIEPLDGVDLSTELKKHHIYLTASINEPGGNHQNEGALCGLPLVYRNSGCMPEYCDGFGISFDDIYDVESALLNARAEYGNLVQKIKSYPNTAEKTCKEYIKLFESLLLSREKIVSSRKKFNPYLFLRNQIDF